MISATVPTMKVCLLTFYSLSMPPFEGGQYVTCKRCERAAIRQTHGLQHIFHGETLKWTCELKDV